MCLQRDNQKRDQIARAMSNNMTVGQLEEIQMIEGAKGRRFDRDHSDSPTRNFTYDLKSQSHIEIIEQTGDEGPSHIKINHPTNFWNLEKDDIMSPKTLLGSGTGTNSKMTQRQSKFEKVTMNNEMIRKEYETMNEISNLKRGYLSGTNIGLA